jgi:hypothetical protein
MSVNKLVLLTLVKARLRARFVRINKERLYVQKVRQRAKSTAALDVVTI